MSVPNAGDILGFDITVNAKGMYPVVQNQLSSYIEGVNADAGRSLVVSNYHVAYETALETQLDTYLGFKKEGGLEPVDPTHSDVFTLINSAIGAQPLDVADALLVEAQAISTEFFRAASVETVITSDLSTEVHRAPSVEVLISTSLSTEVYRAPSVETLISTSLSTEVHRAPSVETVITSDLSTEVYRAPSVETLISTSLSTEATKLSTELIRAPSVEAILSTGISTEIKDRSTEIANLKGASLDKVYDVVSQYVTASAVEAYRTRLWLSEMDRFLNVIRENVSVTNVPTYNESGVVYSVPVIDTRLNTSSQIVLGKVATDFGLDQAILSTSVENGYTVSTGLNTGVGELNATKDTVGNYQQLFSQSG
jgi:hypothetical protein